MYLRYPPRFNGNAYHKLSQNHPYHYLEQELCACTRIYPGRARAYSRGGEVRFGPVLEAYKFNVVSTSSWWRKSIDRAGSRIWTFQDAFEFCVSVPFPPGTRASLRVLSGFDRE